MKMRCLLYIFLITIVSVFAISLRRSNRCSPDFKEPKNWKIYSPKIYNIRSEIIKKFIKKYNLELTVLSGGMPKGIIHSIGVSFCHYQVISKAKARQIILECVQDFLEKINSCGELQQYLYDRPFTVKNIDVSLSILNPDHSKTFYPDLRFITTDEDKIIYKAYRPERPRLPIEEEESFEEALELVKTEIPPEDLS